RSRPRPRIGAHPELDPVEPVRATCLPLARDLARKSSALELERPELGIDRPVKPFGGLAPRGRERGSRLPVPLLCLARALFERSEPLGPGIDAAEMGGVAG